VVQSQTPAVSHGIHWWRPAIILLCTRKVGLSMRAHLGLCNEEVYNVDRAHLTLEVTTDRG